MTDNEEYGRQEQSESEENAETVKNNLITELEDSFFKGLSEVGTTRFDASRFRGAEDELTDDQIEWFEKEVIAYLEEKWNCSIEYSSYDDYEVVHSDWKIDRETGEVQKND